MDRTNINIIKLFLLGVFSFFITTTVYAQLEEVVVTATKRQESTQDIPLSIETLSGDFMMDMGITDMSELADNIPNLSVGYGITAESIGIRGLGSGQERSFEQSVGMFVDGLYAPRSRQYQSPFLDVERVEVARGPQSVIHGLNSTAGAISIVTARTRPGDAAFLDLSADYEIEYGGPSIIAVGGTSLGDAVGVRVAARYSDRDGYFANSFTGVDEGDTEETLIRISAVFEMNEDMTITGKYEYAEKEMSGNTGEIFSNFGDPFVAGTAFAEPADGILDWRRSSNGCANDRNGFPDSIAFPGIYHETCPNQRTESHSFVGNLEWNLPGHTLNIVGGHSEFEYDIGVDLDTSADAFVTSGIDENFEQDSVELRITSDKGNTIDYLAGFYYHKWNNFNENPATFGPGTLGGALFSAGGALMTNSFLETSSTFDQDSKLWSVFAQATWNATDQIRLTGGLRYTDEDKSSTYTVPCNLGIFATGTLTPTPLPGIARLCNSNPLLQDLTVARTSDNLLPEIAGQWDMNEDVMFYAKWGESAKSGGFTSATRTAPAGAGQFIPSDQEYQDEQATGYEAGFKSRWRDNSVELNFAFYRTEFDDLQVNSFTPVGTAIVQRVTNAASATSQGIEMDGRWQINDNFLFSGSLAYTDAEFDNFVSGTCNAASGMTSPCDQSGQPLPWAAQWSGNIHADTSWPVGDNMNFVANVSLSFSDDHFTDASLEPTGLQESWAKLSARVGIEAADERWSLAIVGRNLTDEKVLSASQSFFNALFSPIYLGYLEPPRTIMLQGNYRFGGD